VSAFASEQDSSHLEIKVAIPVPRSNQLTGASFDLTLFEGSGASGPRATFDRTERIRAQEYSNSLPHFKQTWYVRFLIVNTLLFWR